MPKKRAKPKDKPPPASMSDMFEDSRQLLAELKTESDRGVALMAAAYLDTALGILLKKSLGADQKVVNRLLDDGPNAPLGTFASRIAMAYCLGHIGAAYYETLEAIRDIRNAFAHFRRSLTFEDPEIRDHITRRFRLGYVLTEPVDLSLTRNKYIYTVNTVLNLLSVRLHEADPHTIPKNL
ncbi:MAG: MltR family transcriptional regulator [Isosphaeraceae bacterium]